MIGGGRKFRLGGGGQILTIAYMNILAHLIEVQRSLVAISSAAIVRSKEQRNGGKCAL